jgi:hypothetical protein
MRRALALALVTLCTAAAAAGAASPVTPLKFRTVSQGERPVGPDEVTYGVPVLHAGDVTARVFVTAADPTFFYYAFPKSAQTKLDAVDFNRSFVFAAWSKQRSTGYRLAIKRILLQRVSRSARQLCVVATLERPRAGQAVVVRPTFVEHLVAIPSRRFRISEFHYAIPSRFVIRGVNGGLLAVSRVGGSHQDMFVSGRPSLCKASLRADSGPGY